MGVASLSAVLLLNLNLLVLAGKLQQFQMIARDQQMVVPKWFFHQGFESTFLQGYFCLGAAGIIVCRPVNYGAFGQKSLIKLLIQTEHRELLMGDLALDGS